MPPLRTSTKVGVVTGGLIAAVVASVLAVWIRQKFTAGPDALASSGMNAFGDLLLGLVLFGGFALGPLVLALYWLRPVAAFWTWLARVALVYVLTGPLAFAVSTWLRPSVGNWALLADARIVTMPFVALALSICGLFAPLGRPRWILIIAAVLEGVIIATFVLVKFILPQLGR